MSVDVDTEGIPSHFCSKPTRTQKAVRYACLFFNVLCGVTNGYDICVTSVVLNALVRDFDLCGTSEAPIHNSFSAQHLEQADSERKDVQSCAQKQAVMSIAAVGSLCAKICLSWLPDRFGRRCSLVLVDCLILISIALQCLAVTAPIFFCGRFVLGMAMGFSFVVGPTYLCEIAPPEQRGFFVVLNEVAVCVGCLLGLQVAAWILADADDGSGAWRVAVGVGGLPAVVQMAFIFLLPESPRWLALHGSADSLERAAISLGVTGSELEGLRATLENRGESKLKEELGLGTLRKCFRKQAASCHEHGLAFLLSLCVAFFTTASGIFAMQTYAFDILVFSGIQHPRNLLPIMGWTKLFGSLLAMSLADVSQVGRRRLALFGGLLCCACDLVLVAHLAWPGSLPPEVAAVALFAFIFSWNAGYGGVQFASALEMLPNEVRSIWAGQIFAIIGIVEIAIYQLFELLLFNDGVATFALFGTLNFCSALFACFVMPDMEGQSLEVSAAQLNAMPTVAPPTAQTVVTKTSRPRARRYGKLEDELDIPSTPAANVALPSSSEAVSDAI